MPTLGNLCPVTLFRSALQWEFIEYFLDVRKRDSDTLGGSYEGDSAKYIPVEASLVPFVSRTEDEAFAFVEMKCRHSDTASICHLSNRELICRCQAIHHHWTVVLDLK